MRAHCFQHVPFEGPGHIKRWLDAGGHTLGFTRFYTTDRFPNPENIDFLIIMGGPMGTGDEKEFPWLKAEKEFVRRFITSGKPVLGICLGAQIIAAALGAKVYPAGEKEIGWFPVSSVPQDDAGLFRFPDTETVFHWHGDTFELPEGARLLAESKGCRNQAFQLGNKVVGLQFHLETTPESARALVENGRHELVSGNYIQSAEEILHAGPDKYKRLNSLMERVLEYVTAAEK
jgi:GMP synthase-like glutamine amidotransferase